MRRVYGLAVGIEGNEHDVVAAVTLHAVRHDKAAPRYVRGGITTGRCVHRRRGRDSRQHPAHRCQALLPWVKER
jgi:hypothetical protein